MPAETRAILVGVTPVPARGTGSGLSERLFAMVRLPIRLPAAAGVKVILMEQLAPAGTLPTQLSVFLQRGVRAADRDVMLSAMDSLFFNVTVWDAAEASLPDMLLWRREL